MQKAEIRKYLDYFGLYAIGIYSFGYVILKRKFAELNIQLPFLDFPVFIGEILLFVCLSVYVIKYFLGLEKFNRWHCLLMAYLAFVLAKALTGYVQWGPLALRHSALFYYPLFAVLGYSYFRRDFFKAHRCLVIVFLIFSVFFTGYFDRYWTLSLALLAIVLIRSLSSVWLRRLLYVLLALLLPFQSLFRTARMMVVSNFASGMFVSLALPSVFRVNRKVKILITVSVPVILLAGILRFADLNSVRSIVDWRAIRNILQAYESTIMEREKEKKYTYVDVTTTQVFQPEATGAIKEGPRKIVGNPGNLAAEIVGRGDAAAPAEEAEVEQRSPFTLGVHNAAFRILIWRDMLVEMSRERPWLGFGFGKPLRSRSIEILGFATSEWKRDGWIAAHNSYMHIFYRSGAAGLFIIAGFLIVLVSMVKNVIRNRNVTGILLCAIIINWAVAANFLLIYELPYTAIPFWSIFGLTLAYCRRRGHAGVSLETDGESGLAK